MFGKRKYMEQYEDEEATGAADEYGIESKNYPPPVQLSRIDYLIAAILAGVSFLLMLIIQNGCLHPNAVVDCAKAMGLRSVDSVLPGLWLCMSKVIFRIFDVQEGVALLGILGKVSVSIMVGLSYLTLRSMLSLLVRKLGNVHFWHSRLSRIVAIVSSFMLLFSDPIWTMGYDWNTSSFLALLFFFVINQTMRFMLTGKIRPAYLGIFIAGVFSAESALGFLTLISCLGLHALLKSKRFLAHMELNNIYVFQRSKWFLTFFWLSGVLITVGLNVIGFITFEGLSCTGLTTGDLPLQYVKEYWGQLVSSATVYGWAIGIAFVAVTLLPVMKLVVHASDVEYFLKYQTGLIFFFVAVLTYSQFAALRPLWFWTWVKMPEMVPNQLLLSIMVFALMTAFALACAAICIDVFCRNNKRLARMQSLADETEELPIHGNGLRTKRIVFTLVIIAVFVGMVPGRFQKTADEMFSIMQDYVKEVVNEAGDAQWLFTEGAFDCYIEIEAKKRGKNLKCISLQKCPQSRSNWSRVTMMKDSEDRLSAEVGGSNLLSTWERDKPSRLEESAFQLGFELWRRSGKSYPMPSGVLARTKSKMDWDTAEKGIQNAYRLIERILKIYAGKGVSPYAGYYANELFLFMQWRLARMAHLRSEIFDDLKNVERSKEESKFFEELDNNNISLKRIVEAMTRLRELTMRQMTPREGLQFALVRADFSLARRYAEPILNVDPDDVSANFGMGMSYFMEEQFARAEEHLRRCLKRNDKEPAVWNNIAVLQLRTGRFDEAKKNALKALELLPDSVEIKDTLKQIEKAMKDAATNKVNKVESATVKKSAKKIKRREAEDDGEEE